MSKAKIVLVLTALVALVGALVAEAFAARDVPEGGVVESLQAEVVDDEQVRGSELVEASVDGCRGPCQGDVLEELLRSEVPHFVAQHTGLSAQGGGDPALARAGRSGDEDGLPVVDVGAGGELQHLLLLKSPGAVEGELLKASRVSEPRVVYEPCVAVRPAGVFLGL